MTVTVQHVDGSYRLVGSGPGVKVANAFLAHLQTPPALGADGTRVCS